MRPNFKRAVMGAAVVAVLGLSTGAAASESVANFSFNGLFTMLDPYGALMSNTSSYPESSWWYGKRTLISGTMSLNLTTLAGTGTLNDFLFMDDTPGALWQSHDMTMQGIGDGNGGAGSLILLNKPFIWHQNSMPLSLVWDAAGLFSNLPSMAPGSTIGCANTSTMVGIPSNPTGAPCATPGGATAASELSTQQKNKAGALTYDGRMGTLPVVTTTWNTTTVPGSGPGSTVSGSLPLIADAIGGSPIISGTFADFNANFELTQMTLDSYTVLDNGVPTPTPIPAAAWLLGSGLVGLLGAGRRRRWPA